MTVLKSWWGRVAIVIGILFVVSIVYSFFASSDSSDEDLILSEVIAMAQAGDLAAVEVRGNELAVTAMDGSEYSSQKEDGVSIVTLLRDAGVPIGGPDGVAVEVTGRSGFGSWVGVIITFLPLILFGGILFFFIRMAARRSN